MKLRLPLLIGFTILLTACGNNDNENLNPEKENVILPPSSIHLQQIDETTTKEEEEFNKAIESLKKQSQVPNITQEELERGWYYAPKDLKKYATPASWVYEEGSTSESGRWIHPDFIEKEEVLTQEVLCRKTGGTYVKSCNELETGSQCEYISESTCKCPEKTLWDFTEGCLGVDAQGAFMAMSQKELEQGYYYGLSSQRKKGTPTSWLWNAEHGLWHSPYLKDFNNLSI